MLRGIRDQATPRLGNRRYSKGGGGLSSGTLGQGLRPGAVFSNYNLHSNKLTDGTQSLTSQGIEKTMFKQDTNPNNLHLPTSPSNKPVRPLGLTGLSALNTVSGSGLLHYPGMLSATAKDANKDPFASRETLGSATTSLQTK